MIHIHELKESELKELCTACSFLFSPELAGDYEFLENLNPASVIPSIAQCREDVDPMFDNGYLKRNGRIRRRKNRRKKTA